ncbi:hypothetical protein Tco_1228168 [Tanacetum coccineum]
MNHQTSSVPQISYQSPHVSTQSMTESPLVDSGFAVLVFSTGYDLILATIQDGKVTAQQVQGRQGQSYFGEGHMARQCTQPKRPKNAAWYNDEDEDSEDEDDNDDDGDNDADGDSDSDDHDADSDDERTKSDKDECPDPKKTSEEHNEEEEEYDDEFNIKEEEKIDDEESMDEEEDDEVTKELYDDVNKSGGLTQSSSVSFDFISKLLNLDNPSLADNEIASLMVTTAQHATIIPEITSSFTTTIPPPPLFLHPLQQEATPTPTPTTLETTTSLLALPDFAPVFKFNERFFNLEKDVSKIKQVDQYA